MSRTIRRSSFYYLRHGQTDWNAQGRCQGHMDVPLNERGIQQAEEAKDRLAELRIETICCSPLTRARHTAEIVNQSRQCKMVVLDELKEIHFGKAEGRPLKFGSYEELLRSAERHDGERYDDFVDRVIDGINRALEHPEPILVVSHGGVFGALVSRIRLDRDARMANAIPFRFEPIDGARHDWTMTPL